MRFYRLPCAQVSSQALPVFSLPLFQIPHLRRALEILVSLMVLFSFLPLISSMSLPSPCLSGGRVIVLMRAARTGPVQKRPNRLVRGKKPS